MKHLNFRLIVPLALAIVSSGTYVAAQPVDVEEETHTSGATSLASRRPGQPRPSRSRTSSSKM